MTSAAIMGFNAKITDLIGCHCKGVDVGLHSDVALFQTKTRVIHLFRGPITMNNPWFGFRRCEVGISN